MNNIDELLDNLQTQQPIIDNEDAFIDSIMDSLPDLPEEKEERTSPFIIALRTFSSLAASLVIGLFIFLNMDSPKSNDSSADENLLPGSSSAYANYGDCATPQEAMKKFSERKSININQLISMYNENY